MRFVVTVLSLAWALAACAGSASMQDPLIGLSFDPDQIRFEAAPNAVLTAEDKSRGSWYLFAKYEDKTSAGRSYLLVSGLVSVYGDTSPRKVIGKEPEFGFVARCDGARCVALGVPDRMYDDLGLPEPVVKGLLADAVSRLISAYGGKASLQRGLDDFSSRTKNLAIEGELFGALEAAGLNMQTWQAP